METIEGNKLIAEFMGWKHHENKEYDKHEMQNLKYHSEWNWLMPVVEKIEKELDLGMNVVIKNNLCLIYRHKDSPYEVAITPLSEQATKIQSTYLAVVHFIEWYNENLKTPTQC